ncbi:aflatoxin regulatory protein-domain-containing protein [Chaetomium sp. MPI-SDFR-AT-0129]|nr:aflatoxin regulatory protein-domain-containing protein [Chaetomium sp. MPI-SDFR-AT-0129]
MATFQLAMATMPTKKDAEPTKFRDSCNACAVSKIKCTRTKPVCGRCTKRGYHCEYVPTRRAGRKHHPRPPRQPSLVDANGENGGNGTTEGCDSNRANSSSSSNSVQSSIQVLIPTPTTSSDPTTITAASTAATTASSQQFSLSLDLPMTDPDGTIAYPSPSNAFSDGTSSSTPTVVTLPAYETLDHLSWWQLFPASLGNDDDDLLVSQMSFSMPETPKFSPGQLSYGHAREGANTAKANPTSLDENNMVDPSLGDYPVLPLPDLALSTVLRNNTELEGPDGQKLPEVAWEPVLSSAASSSAVSSAFSSSSLPSTTLTASPPPSRLSVSLPSPLQPLPVPSSSASALASASQKQNTPPPCDAPAIHDPYPPRSPRSPGVCCLIRALELLKKLFPGLGPDCNCTCQNESVSGADHERTDALPTIQRVIAENKHTLEAVQDMLQCACLDDNNDGSSNYLLAVISLVVFKVLAWYRAAAVDGQAPDDPADGSLLGNNNVPPEVGVGSGVKKGATTSRRRSSCYAERVLHSPSVTVIDGYRLDASDDVDGSSSRPRMAAQLVFSELHRVQRLVNVLAGRLGNLSRDGNGSSSCTSGGGISEMRSTTFASGSPAWFGNLEQDVRERLRALSLEIVEMLRR